MLATLPMLNEGESVFRKERSAIHHSFAARAAVVLWYMSDIMSIEPFALPYSEAAVEDLRFRLCPALAGPTKYPAPDGNTASISPLLRQLCDYWKDEPFQLENSAGEIVCVPPLSLQG